MELIERIDAALKRLTDGHAPMRIPAARTDVDLVLADAKREIERLIKERDEWAEKWRTARRELAGLKYPDGTGTILADNGGAVETLQPTAWMGEIEAYADHAHEVLVVRSKSEVSPCVPRNKIRWTPLFAGMPARWAGTARLVR